MSTPFETPKGEAPQSAYAASRAARELSGSVDSDGFKTKSPSPEHEEIPPTPFFTMSTWVPKEDNVLMVQPHRAFCEILKNERACFVGLYELRVLEGEVEICGATLRATSDPADMKKPCPAYRVYAPVTHALPVIQGKAEFSTFEILSIRNAMENLAHMVPSFDNIWDVDADLGHDLKKGTIKCESFEYIRQMKDAGKKRVVQPMFYDYDRVFQQIVAHAAKVQDVPKILVCGPLRSGKSTFARDLTNCLNTGGTNAILDKPPVTAIHRSVYFLDLDPSGQEFGPSAYLSLVLVKQPLLGPAMTHPCNGLEDSEATMIVSYPFYYPEAVGDMVNFLVCTKNLLNKYKELTADNPTPLVINTPGWKKDNTLNIIRTLIGICGQNVVIGMKPDSGIGNNSFDRPALEGLQKLSHDYKSFFNFHTGPSRPTLSTRSPKQLSQMREASYFHRQGVNDWTPYPIEMYDTLRLKYEGEKRTFIGVGVLWQLPKQDFLRWETCAERTAALIQITDAEYAGQLRSLAAPGCPKPSLIFDRKHPPTRVPWIGASGLAKPLDVTKYKTLGMVYVSDADSKTAELHIIVPPPLHDTIEEAIVLSSDARSCSFVLLHDQCKQWGWAEDEEEHFARYNERERVEDRGGNAAFVGKPQKEDDGLIASILKNDSKFFEDQAVGHVGPAVEVGEKEEGAEVPCPDFL